MRQRIYLGRIRFRGLEQEVVAVASHAKDVLIGTRLLDVNRCIIDMDFPNRRLQMERSASGGGKD